jgi:hypothetical protein
LPQSFHSRVLVKRQIAFDMPHRTGRFFSRLGGHLNLSRKIPYRLPSATSYDPTGIAVNHFCNYPSLLTISGARRTPSPQHGRTHETTSAYELSIDDRARPLVGRAGGGGWACQQSVDPSRAH